MKSTNLLRIRDLIHQESRIPFYKQVDLYSIEEDLLIGVSGTMGYGFKLHGRDLLLESEESIENFEHRARKFWNSLPTGTTLHIIVKSEEGAEGILKDFDSSIEDQGNLARKVVDAKLKAYREHPFIRREVFLFVVINPSWKRNHQATLPNLSFALGGKARRLSESDFNAQKGDIQKIAVQIEAEFRDLGFRLEKLQKPELLAYLYELLNPHYSKEIMPFEKSRIVESGPIYQGETLRSRLLLSPPVVEDRFFYLDQYFHEVLNLRLLPDQTSLKVMRDFERALGCNYFISITIEVPDQERERAALKKQGNFAKAEGFFTRTKDYEAWARAGESDQLLTEIAQSEDKLLYFSLAVMFREKTKRELDGRVDEALRIFPRLGDAQAICDHMNHDRLFLSFLPLQGHENPLTFLVRSEVLTHLVPLQASWRGTEKMGLLLKTWRDEPLKLDLFDAALQAKHAVMLGTTGSGKSFFTTHLLLHFLIASKTHEVIVIDVGGSYRKLAAILNGSYLEVECSEAYALNPFPRKGILFSENGDADATFLQFLKELLQKMIGPDRKWSASEKMILERAIREVYGPLAKDRAPLLGDVENALYHFEAGDEEDKRKAYQFAKELCLFTKGEYGRLLNREGVFDFDSRFTVFDLRKVSHYPELQEILLFIIPFALRRKFENIALKKILVLDECWRLLKESQGTDLVEVFYRTARKMNAGVLSISQNPEDFLESKIASVIINNSPIKYILRLHKSHEALGRFGLNPNEIQAIRELEVRPGHYSEVFIKFDEQHVLVKLEPTALEYWIATTDPQDQEMELFSKDKPLDLESLEKLAHEFPHGVKKGRDGSRA